MATDLGPEVLRGELVSRLYRQRWQVERFFRWFKCVLGAGRPWPWEAPGGVAAQLYLALLAAVLLAQRLGRRPRRREWELRQLYWLGWARLEGKGAVAAAVAPGSADARPPHPAALEPVVVRAVELPQRPEAGLALPPLPVRLLAPPHRVPARRVSWSATSFCFASCSASSGGPKSAWRSCAYRARAGARSAAGLRRALALPRSRCPSPASPAACYRGQRRLLWR